MTITLSKEAEMALANIPHDRRDGFASEAILQACDDEMLAQIDQMVAEADASGFREVHSGTWAGEMIAECRKRHDHGQ